jgi:GT2 family glycosyltransferase
MPTGGVIQDPECYVSDSLSAHTAPLEFDENAYLAAYEDVNVALDTKDFRTALEHFEVHGRREGRLLDEKYLRVIGFAQSGSASSERSSLNIEAVVFCRNGLTLIVGWTDDRESALSSLLISCGDRAWTTTAFGRVKRSDVNTAIKAGPGHLFGFWAVAKLGETPPFIDPWTIRGRFMNGRAGKANFAARSVSEAELRSTILGYFATTEYYGNRDVESFLALDAGIGAALVDLNRKITASVVAGAWVSYYGPMRNSFKGSIIVCLFGKHEFMFLQAALFTQSVGAQDYEFVYVSNSPELTEVLEKEARLCARIYGISITLVCLPDNAGFGAANNVAAKFARSSRLMITNPDVFPRDNDWARRHADILAAAPAEQTAMFGAPLYYDDGSLMHHGMYFEVDSGVSVRPDGIYARPMIRTEHYGKGAPVWSQNFACPRPVAAVTGAFISADRDWFEKLGGFNEDFLFGHYEDADLSLKSLARGQPAWIQDFPLWHMEGKGSTRRQAQEGGILVNRWLFTRRWGGLIGSHLRGPAPIHPSLAMIQSEGEAVLSAAGGAPEPASDSATFHAARRAGY